MHAKPEKVRARRLKRQLKAALSIGVALCAGVFLACQKTTPAETTRSTPEGDANANSNAPVVPEAASPTDASGAAMVPVDAGKADALVHAKPGPRDAAVDKREHRKGMPVPDNLLE